MKHPTIAVLTGAGVSKGSGIPTYRDGADSLWNAYHPQDLATPEAFARDPELVWKFYDWRRQNMARAKPNAAHLTLAEMETALPGFTLVTQNIDGLHREAGSKNILYLHGDIWLVRCTKCDYRDEDRRGEQADGGARSPRIAGGRPVVDVAGPGGRHETEEEEDEEFPHPVVAVGDRPVRVAAGRDDRHDSDGEDHPTGKPDQVEAGEGGQADDRDEVR